MLPQLEGLPGSLAGGLGVALAVTAGLYLLWLRPGVIAARRERAQAEALHDRLQRESALEAEATLLEARAEAIRIRERAEEDARQKGAALDRAGEKLDAREEALESRRVAIEERERALMQESRVFAEKEDAAERRLREADEELRRIAGLDKEGARDLYLAGIEAEFREAALRKAREVGAEVHGEAESRARRAVLDVLGRSATDYVTEATLSVVELPSEDMKGRIIGREGRNIRSFEQISGVDLIVDETPEAVVISCFDPVRRETARLALLGLMTDGRIHPGRIEEAYEKAQAEVARTVREAGEHAAERAAVAGLPPKVVEAMGRLRVRTSYAQTFLDDCVEVARLAAMLAARLGSNEDLARRAGFLHDIGKGLGPEWEGLMPWRVWRSCARSGEGPVLHAVGAHHHEIEPTTGRRTSSSWPTPSPRRAPVRAARTWSTTSSASRRWRASPARSPALTAPTPSSGPRDPPHRPPPGGRRPRRDASGERRGEANRERVGVPRPDQDHRDPRDAGAGWRKGSSPGPVARHTRAVGFAQPALWKA